MSAEVKGKNGLFDRISPVIDSVIDYENKMEVAGARKEAAISALKYACMQGDEDKINSARDELLAAHTEGVDLTIKMSLTTMGALNKLKKDREDREDRKSDLQTAVDKGAEELQPKA